MDQYTFPDIHRYIFDKKYRDWMNQFRNSVAILAGKWHDDFQSGRRYPFISHVWHENNCPRDSFGYSIHKPRPYYTYSIEPFDEYRTQPTNNDVKCTIPPRILPKKYLKK